MSNLLFIYKGLLNLYVFFKIAFKRNQVNLNKDSINGIVFSMNRPLQLFALLESYYNLCEDPATLYIIYKATGNDFDNGYKEVENYFTKRDLVFVKEKSFKKDLIATLNKISSKYLFFLVDDNIFKSRFAFNDYLTFPKKDNYILSLRLGKNLDYCYTQAIEQVLPHFKKIGYFNCWKWRTGIADWNYVFSVDGHIYNTKELQVMSKLIPFKAPNSYEANMNVFRYILRRKKGLCYSKSILINLCLNRVQNEIENISGEISVEELLNIWQNKKKIDINYFHNLKNKSAHIEVTSLPIINRY